MRKHAKFLGPSVGGGWAHPWPAELLLGRDKTVTKAGLPATILPVTSCLRLFPGSQARRNKIKRISRAWWHQHTPPSALPPPLFGTESSSVVRCLVLGPKGRSFGPPNAPRPTPSELVRRSHLPACVLLYLTRRLCDRKPFKWPFSNYPNHEPRVRSPVQAQKANYAPIKAHTHTQSVWEVRLAGQQKIKEEEKGIEAKDTLF